MNEDNNEVEDNPAKMDIDDDDGNQEGRIAEMTLDDLSSSSKPVEIVKEEVVTITMLKNPSEESSSMT